LWCLLHQKLRRWPLSPALRPMLEAPKPKAPAMSDPRGRAGRAELADGEEAETMSPAVLGDRRLCDHVAQGAG
jgi:hypothetical protein